MRPVGRPERVERQPAGGVGDDEATPVGRRRAATDRPACWTRGGSAGPPPSVGRARPAGALPRPASRSRTAATTGSQVSSTSGSAVRRGERREQAGRDPAGDGQLAGRRDERGDGVDQVDGGQGPRRRRRLGRPARAASRSRPAPTRTATAASARGRPSRWGFGATPQRHAARSSAVLAVGVRGRLQAGDQRGQRPVDQRVAAGEVGGGRRRVGGGVGGVGQGVGQGGPAPDQAEQPGGALVAERTRPAVERAASSEEPSAVALGGPARRRRSVRVRAARRPAAARGRPG